MTSPVLTFLSRSPSASRKTLILLNQLGAMEPILLNQTSRENCILQRDKLDQLFPLSLIQWNSAASKCPRTGTILHLISIEDDTNDHINDDDQSQNLSLLSITPSSVSNNFNESLNLARHTLACHIKAHFDSHSLPSLKYWWNALGLKMWNKLGKDTSAHQIFGRQHNGLPILQFQNQPDENLNSECDIISKRTIESQKETMNDSSCSIREIVLPHIADDSYPHNGFSLIQELTNNLYRPKTGLYQWKNTIDHHQNQMISNENNNNIHKKIFFRPLPASQQDLVLSSPTIVFSCPTLQNVIDGINENNARECLDKNNNGNTMLGDIRFENIGFNGNRKGQLLARHKFLIGLDIRFCESKVLTSTFAESQESLMAGSLDELQSAHVMLEGKSNDTKHSHNYDDSQITNKDNKKDDTSVIRSDAMNGIGDCWVEFRANMKQPIGFLKGLNVATPKQYLNSRKSSKKRTAKAPNLPFQ